MNGIWLNVVFDGFMILNILILLTYVKINSYIESLIDWLIKKQTEVAELKDIGNTLPQTIDLKLHTMGTWIAQTKQLFIPIIVVTQFGMALGYGFATDHKLTPLFANILAIGQAAIIASIFEVSRRYLYSLRSVHDINLEIIKITITDDLDKEIKHIEEKTPEEKK